MFDSRHVTRVARLVAHAQIGSPSCFVLFAVKLTLLLLLSGSLMSKSSHGENVKALVTTVTVTNNTCPSLLLFWNELFFVPLATSAKNYATRSLLRKNLVVDRN